MQFVWWLTGVIATITACRFVILVFKKLTSKENMEDLIDSMGAGLNRAANKVGDGIRMRKEQRKQKKETTQCRVTIH